MTEPVNINAVPKLNLGLQETDEVFISRGGAGPYRVPASSFPWERKGDPGVPGGSWAPVLSLVTNGVQLVLRVVDWVGGTGEKPAALGYVGAAGFVTAAADAVDLRGTAGVSGWSPVLAVVANGERRVQRVVDWTGGAGTKPTAQGYVGALGLVDTAAEAVDVRGTQGIQGNQGNQGIQGNQGSAGWSPVLAVVADGERRVQQVVDWTGGAGDKPATTGYVGAAGIVATAAAAVDVRGAQGSAGWSPVLAVVADGERLVQRVVDWTGGDGAKPATTGYVGATGIVATAAAAVNVRGPIGALSAVSVRDALAVGPASVVKEIGYLVLSGGVAYAAAWSSIWGTSGAKDFGDYAVVGPLALTSSDIGSVVGGFTQATIISDGTNVPTFDGANLADYVNTAGARNFVQLARVGSSVYWSIGSSLGRLLAVPANSSISSPATPVSPTAGAPLLFGAASVGGYPAPTVAYSVYVAGALVASNVTSGSYTLGATTAGSSVIVRAAATNAGGTATADSTAVTIGVGNSVRAAVSTALTEAAGGYGYRYTPTAGGNWSATVSMVSDLTIPENTDGYFEILFTSWTPASQQGPFVGLSTSQTLQGYASFPCGAYCSQAGYWKQSTLTVQGDGNFISNGATGDILRIGRSGTSVIAKLSQDGGTTWRTLWTWTNQSTAALYMAINWGYLWSATARRILGAF